MGLEMRTVRSKTEKKLEARKKAFLYAIIFILTYNNP